MGNLFNMTRDIHFGSIIITPSAQKHYTVLFVNILTQKSIKGNVKKVYRYIHIDIAISILNNKLLCGFILPVTFCFTYFGKKELV